MALDPLPLPRPTLLQRVQLENQTQGSVKKEGLERIFHIESAATSAEEVGNPVYPPARRKLAEHGISCEGHSARQLIKADYDAFDMIIGMDSANVRNMRRICGREDKISMLLDYTDMPGSVADPWYTGDFEATWQDVERGCGGLLKSILAGEIAE